VKQTLTGKFNSEGNIEPYERLTYEEIKKEFKDKDFEFSIDKIHNKRTIPQNNAMHLYFQLLADELNNAGYEMKSVFEVKDTDVEWSGTTIKECLWKPIQKAMTGKDSTTEISKDEVDKIFETLNRHIGENFGIHIPFPSIEEQINSSL